MRHVTDIRVRGYHVDLYGHVNHARHLEILEEARWRFFDDRLDRKAMSAKLVPIVVNVNVDYRAPAKVFDTLRIATATKAIGKTSGVLHHEVTVVETGVVVVEADITFVAVEPTTGRPTAIAGPLLELLEAAR